MSKRRIALTAGTVTVVLGVVLLTPACRWRLIGWPRGEAFYHGRPTSYWLEELRRDDEIMRRLMTGPGPTRPPSAWFGWVKELLGGDERARDWSTFARDPAAVPVLIDLAKRPDRESRRSGVFLLGEMGPAASAAVPVLRELSKDEDWDVARLAEDALEKIAPAETVLGLGGTWTVISWEFQVKKNFRDPPASEARLSVLGDHFRMKLPKIHQTEATPWAEGTLRVDTRPSLKHVDLVHRQWGTQRGIYRLETEVLIMALARPGAERPTAFTTGSDTEYAVWYLRRDEPRHPTSPHRFTAE